MGIRIKIFRKGNEFRVPFEDNVQSIRLLRNRGATVEGNPEARADALVRSREFFVEHLS